MKINLLNALKSFSDVGYHLFRIITTVTIFVVWINIVKDKTLMIMVAISAVLYIMQPSINKQYWTTIQNKKAQEQIKKIRDEKQ